MTNYIAGIEIKREEKIVLIKRTSNSRWYPLHILLEKIKEGFTQAEFPRLKSQFYAEFKEIEKICFLFSVPIPLSLKCIKKRHEF